MAPYEADDDTNEGMRDGRRRAARYVVPVAVLGVAAATIGLVPAFAGSGDPDLPDITAQQLIEKIAASDVERLSGTVKISTDLGLPDLGGLGGALGGAAGGAGSGSSADPSSKLMELASGTHTLRVAADGEERQKLSLLDDAAEYSVIRNGDEVWAYDSASNEAYHVKDSAAGSGRKAPEEKPEDVPATPQDLAEEALKAVDDTTSVTVDGTMRVAGRDAYKLLIEPKGSGSTVGTISVAVDSRTGLPLKFTLTPASGGAAVVDAGFTKVDFTRPAASTFDFTPPKGAKVTQGDEPASEGRTGGPGGKDRAERALPDAGAHPGEEFEGLKVIGKGWTSIARIEGEGGEGLPSEKSGGGDAGRFLDSLGDHVSGKFGSGTVFSTRLVNALITDDGTVYAGAVTKEALVKAADAAE
ncbi:LolA family protein [Streptomyces fructofermentans]|uniref:MucB/RseB N-terminal domain-containing protein n=1 Tax=Streptomyces fructofermentans TaxID=152141 RepID=A0A918KQS9_9ACTN|nr:outer membrane lipoprotein carrier protein LolA [Streptomyces fructofermentans]GGX73259.1 hypothetical protein GCM10010515_46020 [Streptomyces fructofermentans]